MARKFQRLNGRDVDFDNLSDRQWETVMSLYLAPFLDAQQIAATGHRSKTADYPTLDLLETKGLVEKARIGQSSSPADRYWLSRPVLNALAFQKKVPGPGWYGRRRMPWLVERFTVLERIYRAVLDPSCTDSMGPFEGFIWLPDLPFDAIAFYENGWAAITWSGIWENYDRLEDRIGSFLSRLWQRTGTTARTGPYPSALIFVVPDAWQAHMVDRVCRLAGFVCAVLVYNVDEKCWTRRGNIRKGAVEPDVEAIESVISRQERYANIWSLLNSQDLQRFKSVLMNKTVEALEEWPGSQKSQIAIFADDNSKRVGEVLPPLEELGYARALPIVKATKQVRRQASEIRWFAGYKVMERAAKRDRVPVSVPEGRVGQYGSDDRYVSHWLRHESGLLRLVTACRRNGLRVASGWRVIQNLGQQGQLSSDALVLSGDVPKAPGAFVSRAAEKRITGVEESYTTWGDA